MRILHIIPNLRKGGAERICMDICAELNKQNGVTVKLVYLNNLVEYETKNAGYDLQYIPASIQLSLTKPAKFNIADLENLIKNFKPDVIHTHLFEAEIVSRSITYPQAKWFSHCHDNMRQFEPFSINTIFKKQKLTEYYERYYLLNRYGVNGGNNFVAISNDVYQYFERVLPKTLRNLTFLPNAINTAKFTKPKNYLRSTTNADTLQLVTVGTLADKKNQSFLIDVVSELVSRKQNVHLHLLGNGPNRKRLVEKAMHLNLQQHITFHGNVQNVQDFLWASDIYIHGAYYEPFGLVMVEAMAAGLPVVSLDGKGNRDIIQNGKNGYILQQNVSVFADTIINLKQDSTLYKNIVEAGLETALQYDIISYAQKLIALYQQAIDKRWPL